MDDTIQYSPYYISPNQRLWLLNCFWLIVFAFIIFVFTQGASMQSILATLLISFAALLPAYAWCSGWVVGLPVFPIMSVSFIWSHALPLVLGHSEVTLYTPAEHMRAALTITFFLLLCGILWLIIASRRIDPPTSYLEIPAGHVNTMFLALLVFATFYQIALNANWIFLLPAGMVALFRSVFLGLNLIGVFILSYRLGRGTLTHKQRLLFLILVTIYFTSAAAGLILLYALTTFLIATSGYIVGSRKLPWRILLVVFGIVSMLHVGKGEMRAKYWHGEPEIFQETQRTGLVYPWELPQWYVEWIGYALDSFKGSRQNDVYFESLPEEHGDALSLLDRASVIHLLLRIQSQTPDPIPYLKGNTYTILPELLIPRILNPGKISSHEGTHRLSIHYGLQNRTDTQRTTIGWGLVNEAYANFGYTGVAFLAAVLGVFIGAVTLWSIYTPIFSARAMFAIVLMTLVVHRELTAGVFFSVLFQSGVVILAVAFLLMQRRERI